MGNGAAAAVGAGLTPLTEAQEGLWYAQRIDPANPIFNTGQYLEIIGDLDLEVFRSAVAQASAESDALAIRVVEGAGGPVQSVDERRRPALDIVDLRGESDPAGAAQARMRADMTSPLDPSRDALAAQMLFVLDDQRYFWYQRIHHIAIDGYGTALLTRRIIDLYTASAEHRPAPPPLAPYEGVLAEDSEYRASKKRESDKDFWLSTFADRPEVRSLAHGPAVTAHTHLRRTETLPESAAATLTRVAAQAGVPWPDALAAVVAAYVQRHVGGDEVVVGVPSMESVAWHRADWTRRRREFFPCRTVKGRMPGIQKEHRLEAVCGRKLGSEAVFGNHISRRAVGRGV